MKTLQEKGVSSLVLPSGALKPVLLVLQLLQVHAPQQGSLQLKLVLGDHPKPGLLGPTLFLLACPFYAQ